MLTQPTGQFTDTKLAVVGVVALRVVRVAHQRGSFALLGLGFALGLAGDVAWAVLYRNSAGTISVPSLADIFFVAAYLPFGAAVALPGGGTRTRAVGSGLWLDGIVVDRNRLPRPSSAVGRVDRRGARRNPRGSAGCRMARRGGPGERRRLVAGRIETTRTADGHRRFPVAEVRRLVAEHEGRPAVRPLEPPSDPLPALAGVLEQHGPRLADLAAAALYNDGPAGAVVRALTQLKAAPDEIVAARRLFAALGQAHLDERG